MYFFSRQEKCSDPPQASPEAVPRRIPGIPIPSSTRGCPGHGDSSVQGPPPHPSAPKNRDWHRQHPAAHGGAASAPPLPSGHNSGILGTTRAFRRSRMWLFNVTAERGWKTSLLPLSPRQHLWDHPRQPHVPGRICPCSAAMPASLSPLKKKRRFSLMKNQNFPH